MDVAIRVEGLRYRYERAKTYALQGIDLEIGWGEFVAIMGANGAGKTTFCLCLNGIIPHALGGRMKGRVIVAGMDTSQHRVPELAQEVGMVLQDPETQLFCSKVLLEVAFGPENLSVPVSELRQRVQWCLKAVRLEGYEEAHPLALSGGQKQRLAIAAALAMRPRILVLDEPTSQLDPRGVVEVFQVIRELNERYGITVVMTSHHSEEVAEFAERVVVLHEGRVLADGTPREVFSRADVVSKAWIRRPQVAELAHYVAERGLQLGRFPVLMSEALACVQEVLLERGGPGEGVREGVGASDRG